MDNTQRLENQYLKAKISYYEGDPIMSDSEFDSLEQILKNNGSKVIEQVGSKRKDFDFAHPTKMLSLGKIQTEKNGDKTNYVENLFQKWIDKCTKVVGDGTHLYASPKFDGSAINIIYQGTSLSTILTRGDGFTGKDVTKRLRSKVSDELIVQEVKFTNEDSIEIRCEAVIDINVFNEKYFGTREEGKYTNARNFVAGVLGKDDYSQEKIDDITLIPIAFLVNGKHIHRSHFNKNEFCSTNHDIKFNIEDYVDIIKKFEELRKTYNYLLDGVVISFPVTYRETLGENDHEPLWSIAIKFVSEVATTGVVDIEWNVSKRGELTPVVLLKPVQLAGTTVKRASGYNAGYIFNNKIKKDMLVKVVKRGDIIPAIEIII